MKLIKLAFLACFFLLPAVAQSEHPNFVYTNGNKLMLNGSEYQFSAANSYEMLYSQSAADEIFRQAEILGVGAIRLWGFWNDEYNGGALQKLPGEFPEQNWKKFDYVLWKAEQMGIKLIIPLANYWPEFGGIDYYVKHSPTAFQREDFYTDANCIQMYKNYVSYVLNRENTYKNGLRYKDDPTVMIWELMNEPRGKTDTSGNKVYQWIHSMAKYIHDLDPERKHLVSTGEEGFLKDYGSSYDTPFEGSFFKKNSASSEIDVATFHLWPINWRKDGQAEAFIEEWITIHKKIADEYNKPVVLGEFGWQINRTGSSTVARRDQIFSWTYDIALSQNLAGTGFWHLTLNHNPGSITGGELKFPVLVPEDASTNQIIKAFSDKMNTPSISVSEFVVDHADLVASRATTLRWKTRSADTVTINGQAVAANGEMEIRPSSTTKYTITATGPGSNGNRETVNRELLVVVGPARASSIDSGNVDSPIPYGQRAQVSASVRDQMGEYFSDQLQWSVSGGGVLSNTTGASTQFISNGAKGQVVVTASYGNLSEHYVVSVGELNINDSEIQYSGNWNQSTGEGKFKGDDHYSSSPGASYQLRFYGSEIAIYGPLASHHGTGWVSINGGPEESVNFKANQPQSNVKLWQKSGLSASTEHVLTLRVGNNGVVVADRFEVISQRQEVDLNDNVLDFFGNWTPRQHQGSFKGDEHVTQQAGAGYNVTLYGKQFALYATKEPGYGRATVEFDGKTYPVDFGTDIREDHALIWQSPEVPEGKYSLKLTAAGGKPVVADRINVSKVLPARTENDSGFSFSGNWQRSTGEGKYLSDDHYSNEQNASYTAWFEGSKVVIYGSVAGHHGSAAVFIDDVYQGDLQLKADYRVENIAVWESPLLPDSTHKVEVRAKGDGVIVADRIDIFGSGSDTTPPDSLYLEAEDALVSPSLQIESSFGNYTGSGYVTGFNLEPEDTLTWTFNVSEAKRYQIAIRYSAGYGSKRASIALNGNKVRAVDFNETPNFDTWRDAVFDLDLSAGQHSISIITDSDTWGWFNIDALQVR